jgi:hypothetical protein
VCGVDSKLPVIVHTRDLDDRAVPTGEVSEVLQMVTPGALSRASLEEATKHDDAEVPIWLWSTWLKMQACIFGGKGMGCGFGGAENVRPEFLAAKSNQ